MKRLSLPSLALCLIAILALTQGCTKKPVVNVTGKWAEVDGPDTVEFTSDGNFSGSFIYDSAGFKQNIAGKFSADGDKISLNSTDNPKDSMVWKIKLDGGVLQVTYQQGGAPKLDGSTAKFHRSN